MTQNAKRLSTNLFVYFEHIEWVLKKLKLADVNPWHDHQNLYTTMKITCKNLFMFMMKSSLEYNRFFMLLFEPKIAQLHLHLPRNLVAANHAAMHSYYS